MANTKLKASDRQTLLRKVMAILKRKYGGSIPKDDRNVLQTMLFACCLENSRYADAEAAHQNLLATFHDLNEIRVSSITEVERSLEALDDAAWRAFRVRDILQYVFEEYYVFDFESLRRKTLEAAEKQLSKIKGLSPFVQLYTLQHVLGAHVVPIDDVLCRVVAWLGLVDAEAGPQQAADEMKSAVRKSDVPLLCQLLRELGTDPAFKSSFKITKSMMTNGAVDAMEGPERLEALLANSRSGGKVATRTRRKPAVAPKRRTAARAEKEVAKKPVAKKVSRPKPAADKKTNRRGVRN